MSASPIQLRPIVWGPWRVELRPDGTEWWACDNLSCSKTKRLEPYKTDLGEVIRPPVWGKDPKR